MIATISHLYIIKNWYKIFFLFEFLVKNLNIYKIKKKNKIVMFSCLFRRDAIEAII